MSEKQATKKASPQDWHPADICAAVRKRGTSLRKLSVASGFQTRALSHALSQPYWKAQEIIATFLGVTPQEIWPSRYHPDGSRKVGLLTQLRRLKQSSADANRVNGNTNVSI